MRVFWNGIAIILAVLSFLFVLWFLAGCDDAGSPPTRLAYGIRGSTDNVRTCHFQYTTATSDPITREGVRMDIYVPPVPSYLVWNGVNGWVAHPAPDIQRIETTGITDKNGIVTATGRRDNWQVLGGYTVSSTLSITLPHSSMSYPAMTYRTNSGAPRREVALLSIGQGPVIRSAKAYGDILTASEIAALLSTTEDAPHTGFAVVSSNIALQGTGYVKDDDFFMANNIPTEEGYFRFAAPSFFTVTIKTASPVNLNRLECRSIVRTNAFPQGVDVPLYVVGANADGQTHVVRTDYFLPIDSELPISQRDTLAIYDRWTPLDGDPNDVWDEAQYARFLRSDWMDIVDPNEMPVDPNMVQDDALFIFVHRLNTSHPLFMVEGVAIPERSFEVKVIPIGAEGDRLYLRPDKSDMRLLMHLLEHWLTDEPTYDANGDGIVNLKDFSLAP